MAPRSKYRTKICRNFVAGQCAYGTKCTFIHPPPVFPPSNILSPFARQPVLNWSALQPRTIDFDMAQYPVAGPTIAAPVYETPFSPSPLSSAFIAGTGIVRPKGWRTNACKHFVRTQGWCPLGDACNFIHDALFLRGSDQIPDQRDVSPRCDACVKEPWSIDNTAMGATRAHCWAYIQGMCMDSGCQFLHPEDDSPYVAYTPCPRWPNCSDGTYCAFQHPASISVAPAPLPLPPPSTGIRVPAIQNHGSPVSSETSALPCGTYEINGTTYFSPQIQIPVVPLPTSPSMLYDHATIAHSIYDPTIYARSYHGRTLEASNHVYDQGTYPDGDWEIYNSSDPQLMEINELKEQLSVPVQEVIRLATSDPGAVMDRFTSTQTNEFPYRPPENQRVGHAKRISIQMKKVEALSLTAVA